MVQASEEYGRYLDGIDISLEEMEKKSLLDKISECGLKAGALKV